MNSATLIVFLTTIFFLCISPGPTMLLALATSMNSGIRVAFWGVCGATLGNAILIGLVAFGLGSLLTASLTVFTVLKFIGSAYMCWLAYQLWFAQTVPIILKEEVRETGQHAFSRAATVSLTNPKGILFLSVFLPQFIDIHLPTTPQYTLLGILLLGMDLIMMAGYILLGRRAASLLTSGHLRLLNRVCALFMLFLALGLASYQRS